MALTVKSQCLLFCLLLYFHKIRCRGFLKNRRNGDHAEGTAAGVTFCLPGVQRTGSPLCLDCKGWQHLAGVKGRSPQQVKGGSHCPVIWRFAIWYWVLSVTATEPLSSFAAIPSGKQLERKEKCEMKGTRHNGRSGKNGVYNPLHNDRRFNPEHSEHIDNEIVRQNIYWDCYH